ncbi:MAG: sporulation transcriptional regulator SpoIIID [Clostridia bacterium]|nr:sporulation transcriptional regulator SpoIIID [Clostridia bacterium]
MLVDNDLESVRIRCEKAALYIIENRATVRSAAAKLQISKSTVHKDVTQRLLRINPPLYERVKEILEQNKKERHIRGGEATRKKYLKPRLAQKDQDTLCRE